MANEFIPSHGGYKKLLSYQKAEIIMDATVYFTGRFFPKGDRTVSQMVQAARSGKQNIAEASMTSGTSKDTEIVLTNVARASLEELLADYRDFLRKMNLVEWQPDHPYVNRLQVLIRTRHANYDTFRRGVENENPEICANVIIGLIKVTTFLLYKQIQKLEADFIQNGGIKERMHKARTEYRKLEWLKKY